MQNEVIEAVFVAGFHYSGSGAVVDLLKEFKSMKVIDGEFNLIKWPDGIMDLEESLVENWRIPNISYAIKRFKRLIKVFSRNGSKLCPLGFGYNKFIAKDFEKLTNKYIDDLISFTFVGDDFNDYLKAPYFVYILNKIKKKLGKRQLYKYYFSYPENEFYSRTKEYFNDLFKLIISNDYKDEKEVNAIVFDQGVSACSPLKPLNYFYSAKVIIVDRDPRDIFIDALKDPTVPTNDINNFILYCKARRKQLEKLNLNDNRILKVKFEDLILDYDNTLEVIYKFLNINRSDHILKGKFLDTNISKNNIGQWKNHKNQKDIDLIYSTLKKYCFNNK